MTFRGDRDAASARIAELESTLAARDRELESVEVELRARDEAASAALPRERDRVRVRQLEAAIAKTRQEAAERRARLADAGTNEGRESSGWLTTGGAVLTLVVLYVIYAMVQR